MRACITYTKKGFPFCVRAVDYNINAQFIPRHMYLYFSTCEQLHWEPRGVDAERTCIHNNNLTQNKSPPIGFVRRVTHTLSGVLNVDADILNNE